MQQQQKTFVKVDVEYMANKQINFTFKIKMNTLLAA